MINARPKTNTIFSIAVFLIIAFGIFTYAIVEFLDSKQSSMFILILMYTSGPIGLAVMFKTIWGIKLIKISKEKFEIGYPFRFRKIRFTGKDLDNWRIEKIKTFGGMYEELILTTKSKQKVTLSKQEHTDYDKARKYMEKKFKKIKR